MERRSNVRRNLAWNPSKQNTVVSNNRLPKVHQLRKMRRITASLEFMNWKRKKAKKDQLLRTQTLA